MPTREDVMQALTQCYDPEIPVNIVDLGLIYDVRFNPASGDPGSQDVEIEMTMTSQGCPAHVGISEDVRRKVRLTLIWCGHRLGVPSGLARLRAKN